jgi:hypothetical protein
MSSLCNPGVNRDEVVWVRRTLWRVSHVVASFDLVLPMA